MWLRASMVGVLRAIAVTCVDELLWPPVWWYTAGAVHALQQFRYRVDDARQRLAVGVWLRNLFTPMYGQYDMAGRLISIVVRLIEVLVRSVMVLVATTAAMLILAAYFLVPVLLFTWLLLTWATRS